MQLTKMALEVKTSYRLYTVEHYTVLLHVVLKSIDYNTINTVGIIKYYCLFCWVVYIYAYLTRLIQTGSSMVGITHDA